MKVRCDCAHEFTTSADFPTCPSCHKRFRSSTHGVATIVQQPATPRNNIKKFKPAMVEIPSYWLSMCAIANLKFLSMYDGKVTDGAPSGWFYDELAKITQLIVNDNMKEIKMILDKIDQIKFKMSILNIGGSKKNDTLP